jgi:hypothetical protein
MHLQRLPDDDRSGWGISQAGAQSFGLRADSIASAENGAAADRNACAAFFDLTQRAGRIARRDDMASPWRAAVWFSSCKQQAVPAIDACA